MASAGHGFREVVLDQKFDGIWINVSVPPGGGHTTFQGTKFSDFAGGFTYDYNKTIHPAVSNRMIYWRTLNDKLELIETSLDYNLRHNQVRFTFQDSPIVGPVTIQELDQHIVILVATVTSVNRIVLRHPKLHEHDKKGKNSAPSVFMELKDSSSHVLKTFHFAENCHNIPVPASASSLVIGETGDSIFALSYDTGELMVIRVDKHDMMTNFDLRQTNMFMRMFSGFKQTIFNRNTQTTADATVALNLYLTRSEEVYPLLYLTTLSMNGRLRIWQCKNFTTFQDWPTIADVIVENSFVTPSFTDYNLQLRHHISSDSGFPTFVLYLPGRGFKFYEIIQQEDQVVLEEGLFVDFRERELVDYSITDEYLFVLMNNLDEETDWQVKTYKLGDLVNSRFNLALLEPLPSPNVEIYPSSHDPRSFYTDLIFNKSSFSISTIYKALGMFASTYSFERNEKDWEKTKQFAHDVINYEILTRRNGNETKITDDEYYNISLETWMSFYNSCVEFHTMTVKPLGIFFNQNLGIVGVVKKSRLSFLRATEDMETLYYFPHCAYSVECDADDEVSDDQQRHLASLVSLMDVLELIESTTEDIHSKKIEKQLRLGHSKFQEACLNVVNLITMADPNCLHLERRHFAPSLEAKLRDENGPTKEALDYIISMCNAWNGGPIINTSEFDDRAEFTEFYMASRLGANMLQATVSQISQHRFMIAKDLMLLHFLLTNLFGDADPGEIKIRFTMANITDATLAVNNSFLLNRMLERKAEVVPDNVIDFGLRVANLVRANTSDHIARGQLSDPFPRKLLEQFFESYIGNASIRRYAAGSRETGILVFAEAAGRAIWPSESPESHPFEDFLISHCQYGAMYDYASLMTTHLTPGRLMMQRFFKGVASLCDGDFENAVVSFQSMKSTDALKSYTFFQQLLATTSESDSVLLKLYQKIISLFQVFKQYRIIQDLAEEALNECPAVKDRTMMASLAFKSALQLNDHVAAYDYVLRIPTHEDQTGKTEVREKTASLRTLIRALLEGREIETLLNLDLRCDYSLETTVQQKVEEILDAQAKLSDPLSDDGVYQMLYVYYIAKEKYYEGALAMYSRMERIGEKGGDLAALEAQRDALNHVLTCIGCLADRNQPLKIQKIGVHAVKPGGPLLPGDERVEYTRTYEEIVKELNVCIGFITLAKKAKIPVSPVRPGEFLRWAQELIPNLSKIYHFDLAIKISQDWEQDLVPVLVSVAWVYTAMVCDIRPESENMDDYIRHNNLSGLPVSNVNATETCSRLLERYVKKLEEPFDSKLHQAVTLEILAYSVQVPQWLVDSYKKRKVAQLIECYRRYGEYKEAVELCNKVIDATLGKYPESEFDPSIQVVDIYNSCPYLPTTVIDSVIHQIELRYETDNDPEKLALIKSIKPRCNEYCQRVNVTRHERQQMFGNIADPIV